MKKPKDKTTVERQARFKQRMKAAGLIRVSLWIPAEFETSLKLRAALAVQKFMERLNK